MHGIAPPAQHIRFRPDGLVETYPEILHHPSMPFERITNEAIEFRGRRARALDSDLKELLSDVDGGDGIVRCLV